MWYISLSRVPELHQTAKGDQNSNMSPSVSALQVTFKVVTVNSYI